MLLMQMGNCSAEKIFIPFLIKGFFLTFNTDIIIKKNFKIFIAKYDLRKIHQVFKFPVIVCVCVVSTEDIYKYTQCQWDRL